MNIPTEEQMEEAINEKVSEQTGDTVKEILPVIINEMNKVLKDKGEDTISFREKVITSIIVSAMTKHILMVSASMNDDMMNKIVTDLMIKEIKV